MVEVDYCLISCELKQDLGITRVDWSFARKPRKTIPIICHVVSRCTYDLILGRKFLNKTRTLTKYRDRLADCLSPRKDVPSIKYLGNKPQRLVGVIGDLYKAFAIPDTGADRNVMDMR